MRYVLIGLAVFVCIMIFFMIIYFKDVNKHSSDYVSKFDEKTGKY